MSNRITQQELESNLWGVAVLLRGLIDAGDHKQLTFPLLFFKRIAFSNPSISNASCRAFQAFAPEEGFSVVATLAQIADNGANLSIPFYVKRSNAIVSSNETGEAVSLSAAWEKWQTAGNPTLIFTQ